VGEDYTGVERINDDIEPFIELWSSPKTVCGLTVSHALYCWGESSGPNGQASSTDNWLPVKLDIGVDAIASDISLSPDHACALRNSGKAVCWGAGTDGQLGYGFTSDSDTYRVVEVANWVEFEQITTGAAHSCAMNSLGGVMCWGNNSYGQLGDGTTTRRTTPVNVTILPSWLDVVEVHAVRDGTCVVDETYGLWCWGNNANGQLGLNQSITVAATPQPIRFSM
jgi:alpha-tubulin suppressor-like RCC1 family protein